MPAKYLKSDALVSRNIAGETIVVPIRGGVGDLDSVYTFNGSGNAIWSLLDKERTAEEIAQAIQEEFSAEDLSQVLSDVEAFLEELLKERLIRPA